MVNQPPTVGDHHDKCEAQPNTSMEVLKSYCFIQILLYHSNDYCPKFRSAHQNALLVQWLVWLVANELIGVRFSGDANQSGKHFFFVSVHRPKPFGLGPCSSAICPCAVPCDKNDMNKKQSAIASCNKKKPKRLFQSVWRIELQTSCFLQRNSVGRRSIH